MSITDDTTMFLHTRNWISRKADLYLSVLKPDIWSWYCYTCENTGGSANNLTALINSWNVHEATCGLDIVPDICDDSYTIEGDLHTKKGV